MRHRSAVVLAVALLVGGLVSPTPPARAEPATATSYPPGATSTRYSGLAFDACTAPSVAQLTAWQASPYRAVAIYAGGVNRTCAQPQLTASWVAQVTARGWSLLPVYKGLQPWCGARPRDQKITAAGAQREGVAAAVDAVTVTRALGILPGSGLYLDIEHYATTDTACRTAVLTFVSGWTRELHRRGYVAGVYANLSSGALHLAGSYGSTAYARPDALWIARWDGSQALTGWAGIPDSRWAVHQRAKQYRGDHTETYGGVTINIDSNRLDTAVATVARTYRVTSSTPLAARSGPATTYGLVKTYGPGTTLSVVCQALGTKVGTTSVWDKLSDGTYVTDYYVSTPSNTTWSAPLPRCRYPFQELASGSLAWVVCQQLGPLVGGTRVWNRLDDGRLLGDASVATPSATTWSAPVPRC